jgi:PEP-CTERM motif
MRCLKTASSTDRFRQAMARAASPWTARIRSGHLVAAALWLAIAQVPAGSCRAGGLIISAPDITAAPGSSGSFLVLLTDTDPSGSQPFSVFSDSFQITATAGQTDVTFTGATTSTGGPPDYIYPDSLANVLFGGSIDTAAPGSSFPTMTSFAAVDSAVSTATTISPGDVVSLGLISYTISASAAPGAVIALQFGGNTNPFNSLSDAAGNPVAFTTMDGSITISGGTAVVPEPSTLTMAMLAVVIAPLMFRRLHDRTRGNRPQ